MNRLAYGRTHAALASLALLLFSLGRTSAANAQSSLINLLRLEGAAVGVSSLVNNSAILPEHLLDGKLETAWNSRPGDLVGAWIAFRVPRTTRVKQLRLSAGFVSGGAAKKGTPDLFLMNHRVKRLRLFREGKALGELTLDVDQRTLQTFTVDQPGGEFRLEVAATVPGSKPRWRETCISELEVLGLTPPGIAASAAPPSVAVGTLPATGAERFEPLSPRLAKLRDEVGAEDVVLLCGRKGLQAVNVHTRKKVQLATVPADSCVFDPAHRVVWMSQERDGTYDLHYFDLHAGAAAAQVLSKAQLPVNVAHTASYRTISVGLREIPEGSSSLTLHLSDGKVALVGSHRGVSVVADADRIRMEGRAEGQAQALARKSPVLGRRELEALARRASFRAGDACQDSRRPLELQKCETDAGIAPCTAYPVANTSYYWAELGHIGGSAAEDSDPKPCLYDPARRSSLAVFRQTSETESSMSCLDSYAGARFSASGRAFIVEGRAFVFGGPRRLPRRQQLVPGRAFAWLWGDCGLVKRGP